MRRFIAALVAITVLFSAAAFADDLSAMTDEELYALHLDVLEEMTRRGLEPEADTGLPDLLKLICSFFMYRNENKPDDGPSDIKNREQAEGDASAGDGDDTADPVLYYEPSGGQYYHLDPNCRLVNPRFLPLKGAFLYSELNEEPYCDLNPCAVCEAPPAPETESSPSGAMD